MHAQLAHGKVAADLGCSCLRSRPRHAQAFKCQARRSEDAPAIEPVQPKRVLIIGGTGRVGSSTAVSLLQLTPGHTVTLAGRERANYDATVQSRPSLATTEFLQLNINDGAAVQAAATGQDLVIHTAGPFQRRASTAVLEACIAAGTPYIDVCDDMAHSQLTKGLHDAARDAGVPCITTGGIYPGISNVMAAHMISCARQEYDDDWAYRVPDAGEGTEPKQLLYSYFTAGTGGVGPTILETSFLLAGSPTTAYKDNVRYTLPPVSERRTVDFGPGLGRKDAWLYNLPEVQSGHEVLRVPSVSARFGTSPPIWNWGMWLVARLAPKAFLEDPVKVKAFSDFVGPLVRASDAVTGEAVGMRVEVLLEGGQQAVGLFVHKYLSETVGSSTAAFAEALLEGGCLPGVWFPEEREALVSGAIRRRVMYRAAQGQTEPASRFDLNKALWEIESEPTYLAMGMYW